MSNCLISITSILLTLTAPVFSGTLFAVGFKHSEWPIMNYYSINPDNRLSETVTTTINKFVTGYTDIEYDCLNGKMYGVGYKYNQQDAYIQEINPDNGNAIGDHVTLSKPHTALEFVGSTLYGWDRDNSGLSIINPTTGETTAISENVPVDSIWGLAYDICTNTMYGVTDIEPSWLFSIDLDTGLPCLIGNTETVVFEGLEFGDNCVLFGSTSGGADGGKIYTIDTETGNSTLFASVEDLVSYDYVPGVTFVPDNGGCPTKQPTSNPTMSPTGISSYPTKYPTTPTQNPTKNPTVDDSDDSSGSDSDDSSGSDENSNIFGANNAKHMGENDSFGNDKNMDYVLSFDDGIVIIAIISLALAVNMIAYCLKKT